MIADYSNEHQPNCYHQNNSISLTSDCNTTHGNELRTENPCVYLEDKAVVKKHLNIQNQTTISKCTGNKSKFYKY